MNALRTSKAFTLIELLVVVTVLGVLAGIMISQFTVYRQRGYDARAHSDLRNAASAEEAYFATYQAYVGGTLSTGFLPSFVLSDAVIGSMTATNGANPAFSGTATSSSGSGKTFTYDNGNGGMQ